MNHLKPLLLTLLLFSGAQPTVAQHSNHKPPEAAVGDLSNRVGDLGQAITELRQQVAMKADRQGD